MSGKCQDCQNFEDQKFCGHLQCVLPRSAMSGFYLRAASIFEGDFHCNFKSLGVAFDRGRLASEEIRDFSEPNEFVCRKDYSLMFCKEKNLTVFYISRVFLVIGSSGNNVQQIVIKMQVI